MDLKSEFNRHAEQLIAVLTHCPLCIQPCEAKWTKRKKVHISCRACVSRIFVNSVRALEWLIRCPISRGRLPGFQTAVVRQYSTFLKAKDQDKLAADYLARHGYACAICRSPAGNKRDKYGRPYQHCLTCASFILLHSPMGIAGFCMRDVYYANQIRLELQKRRP